MIGSILAKVFAEGLVTLYTVVVRTSSFSPLVQSALRSLIIPFSILPFLLYFGVPGITGIGNWLSYMFSLPWIGIGIVNLLHIISSFEGFKILPTGPAVTLYFTYPLMAVILTVLVLGGSVTYQSVIGVVIAFVGTILLQSNHIDNGNLIDNRLTMNLPGVVWILLSAFTEAILYLFVISGGKEYNNQFFTLYALYFWAGIISLFYLIYTYTPLPLIRESSGGNDTQSEPPLLSYDTLYLLLANLLMGVGGKALLYSSARGLSTGSYAALSYIGIVFAYIYGLFLGDGIKMNDIFASLLITFGSIYGGVL